ncbi:MAG TPA: FGGY family carbohydrate kinase [Sphingobacterium sp.]|nr:FGGY family carbohydrate kinase [Sphingobacterium sp.]
MHKKPVIAIFDVGKTNKKLFLFDENYQIVFERSARFLETVDEDGDPCENLESLRLSVFDSLHEVFRKQEFAIKAINFTTYGASFVYLDKTGRPTSPLYNYLKPYPEKISQDLYEQYGGEEEFCLRTASPALGSLNSGLQLYRMAVEKPEVFSNISHALHLPQYMSFLISGELYSDMTSIGCHTALWDFKKGGYHEWVKDKGLLGKFPPIVSGDQTRSSTFPGSTYIVGTGLHDSSAALIPYLLNFQEPFVLVSTGTWSISFNPFNEEALTKQELDKDCLLYFNYLGKPVKASRLFLGNEHDIQSKRIASFFAVSPVFFRGLKVDGEKMDEMLQGFSEDPLVLESFSKKDLSLFKTAEEAYYALMAHLVNAQVQSLTLIMSKKKPIKRLFVDGGFSKNQLFMQMLAKQLNEIEVFAASMAQATALGAALVIHESWNRGPLPGDLIELKYYSRLENQKKQ